MVLASLEEEAAKMSDMLRGKIVKAIKRHRTKEVMIEFSDGTRLFVDRTAEGLDFSIADGYAGSVV